MARHRIAFRGSKSIAGTVLAALGMFILYQNLDGAVIGLRHVLHSNGAETLGLVLSLSQVLQAYAADHQRLLHGCFHLLVSSWPLLLVRVGTVWSRDALIDNVSLLRKKDCALVDLAGVRSTLK